MGAFLRLLLGVVGACSILLIGGLLLGGLSQTTITTRYHRLDGFDSIVFVQDGARGTRFRLAGKRCFKTNPPSYYAALNDVVAGTDSVNEHSFMVIDGDAADVVRRLRCP